MFAKGCFWWLVFPLLLTVIFGFVVFFIDPIFLFLFIIFLFITVFFLIFFRDPDRNIGKDIVSPADGTIRDIIHEQKYILISIFMDVYNVHVNRMPIDGTIQKMKHIKGKHFRALKKESDENERVLLDINTTIGKIQVVQIAGLIARRIYPYITAGDQLKKGEKIGIIRLGSRVDTYLPLDKIKSIPLKIGDKVLAGVTTIAEIK
jgi:phosphatidylserine decarboxylase